jgi:surfeit locus 1 family protein
VPTVFVVGALIVLVNLGLWQIRRHGVTAARLAEIDAVHDGVPVGPADLTGSPDALKWRRAELTGAFAGARAYVTGRYEMGLPGFDVLQAFAVDGGPTVLVNRGWIPLEGWSTADAGLADGASSVHGLVLPIEGPADLQPIPPVDGLPERWPPGSRADLTGCNQVSYSPYRVIAARSGQISFPVVIVAGDSLEDGKPKPQAMPVTGYYVRPEVRPHLEYAATWFSIAVVLLLLWLYAGFIRGARARSGQ